ncbi:hypothetical protein ES703_79914 [subsurface metagenome]
MAILLKERHYKLIKSQLKKNDTISIAYCTGCSGICGLGEKKVNQLSEKLKKNGFKIADMDSIPLGCLYDQVKKQKKLKNNTTIVWGCDSYVYNLKRVFPKRKVIPALITLGLMVWDAKGRVHMVKKYKQSNKADNSRRI